MGACVCKQRLVQLDLLHNITTSWPGQLPQEELAEIEALKPGQALAVLQVRRKCAHLNQRYAVDLLARAELLGFTAHDVEQTLTYIRDEAPLIIHVDIEKYGKQLAMDSHYRNMFETRDTNDNIHANSRMEWEARLFGRAYEKAVPFDRCKYGVLNVTNDPQGVRCCAPIYGSSYLLLKGVRLRTTFSGEDSAELESSDLATVDCYAHILARYTDLELRAALEVGTRRRPGLTSLTIQAYKEAQIHGEVRLQDHVAMVMAHPSLAESSQMVVERLAAVCNAPLVWMQDLEDGGDLVAQEMFQDVIGAYENRLLDAALRASEQDM